MSHSLNEIEAMAKKAARGAGMSWGLCEEAGKAVRWLESHELPGIATFIQLLEKNDGLPEVQSTPISFDGVWTSVSGQLGPILSGAALNDSAEKLRSGTPVELAEVSFPMLLVPFVAWAALHLDQPVEVKWGNLHAVSNGYDLALQDPDGEISVKSAALVTVSKASKLPELAISATLRGNVDADVWSKLATFAHRTYAPATEESRMLGAGAGVTDND